MLQKERCFSRSPTVFTPSTLSRGRGVQTCFGVTIFLTGIAAEPLLSLSQVSEVSMPMSEELVRSCESPQKVQHVRETLKNERDRIKCAIKLLSEFFTTDEMAESNTEGNYGKQPLDKTKLRTLKGNSG